MFRKLTEKHTYKHTHRQNRERCFLSYLLSLHRKDHALLNRHRLSMKTKSLLPGLRNLHLSSWLKDFKKPLKLYEILALSFVTTNNLKLKSYCHVFQTQDLEKWRWNGYGRPTLIILESLSNQCYKQWVVLLI